MRKIVLLFTFLGLCSFSTFAQSRLFRSGEVKKGVYLEVPFEVFHGHLIITADVNGVAHRFLFDTGAPNVIRKEFLSTTSASKQLGVSDSENQSGKMNFGIVDSLTLGGVNFYNYAAMEHDFSVAFPFSCYNITGFIGSNLLRGLIVKINLKSRKLIITDDLAKVSPQSKPIRMKLWKDQLLPYVPFAVGTRGKIYEVLFDSGYNGLWDFSKKDFKAIRDKEGFVKNVVDLQGTGSVGFYGTVNSEQYAATMVRAKLGEATLDNINFTTSNGGTKVGAKLLEYGDVILDYKNKTFYFEANSAMRDLATEHPAYTVSAVDERFVIGYVLREDLKTQIKPGDQILGVDGVDISALSPCDMFEISPRAKHTLQVLSDGKVLDIKI